LTSRIDGDLTTIRAGFAGMNAAQLESGNRQLQVMAGEPFTLEFHVTRTGIRVFGNGKATGGINFAPDRFPPGAIGLFVATGGVSIRKLEIKEAALAAPPVAVAPLPMPKQGFVSLFNAKDLTGWQAHPKRPGNWRVDNGILIGSAPNGGSLYSTRGDYQDFHLRAEARINDKGFSRVFVRAAYDPAKIPFKVLGYEALINQRPVGDKIGTLRATSVMGTAVTLAAEAQTRAGDWFVLEVVAKGDRVTVSVNGRPVADFVDDKREFARKGHIVLHQDANAALEFRKVEVRDLADAK
jgi:antitoxin (DNA-binding transcriptional repressor) of toxin-antitoxin stability system